MSDLVSIVRFNSCCYSLLVIGCINWGFDCATVYVKGCILRVSLLTKWVTNWKRGNVIWKYYTCNFQPNLRGKRQTSQLEETILGVLLPQPHTWGKLFSYQWRFDKESLLCSCSNCIHFCVQCKFNDVYTCIAAVLENLVKSGFFNISVAKSSFTCTTLYLLVPPVKELLKLPPGNCLFPNKLDKHSTYVVTGIISIWNFKGE